MALIALVKMSIPKDAPTKPLMRITMSQGSDCSQKRGSKPSGATT